MERLTFASPSQITTTELNILILAVSIFLSHEGASRVLSLIGIKVSHDTIKRIYDSITIEDEADTMAMGIDDVAIRKGQSYATVIYDLKDHHLVALLKGRDADTLKEWLKNHKKIKMVARDRASTYAHAINEILPDCIQVTEEEIVALDHPTNYRKRKIIMDDYLNIIYKMLRDKREPATTMSYVIKKGYDGNCGTLEDYIRLLAKNNFNIRLGRN